MESNSDKRIKGKLLGLEEQFDPAAWSKMEAMLDKKKRRPAFFWWWTGGSIAAVLLAGLWYNSVNQNAKSLNQQTAQIAQKENSVAVPAGKEITELQTIESASQIENTGDKLPSKEIKVSSEYKPETKQGTTAAPALRKSHSATKQSRKEKVNNALTASSNEGQASFVKPNTTATTPVEQMAAFEVDDKEALLKRIEEAAMLQKVREAGIVAQSDEEESEKSPIVAQESLKNETNGAAEKSNKKKPTVFSYQIGASANVTATSVGAQTINGKQNLIYRTPSFAAGLSQEFLFLNRFAITTGLLYAQTSYRIEKPTTDSAFAANRTYNNYSAKISELNIPVGIKVYPYNSEKVRVFLHGGIVNHIKLKETFISNITEPSALVNIPPTTNFDNSTVNTYNNAFGGGQESTNSAQDNSDKANEADYFGIGGRKRYYASFYSSVGVEVVVRKRIHIVAEPMYQLLLSKMGKQDNTKHNFGLSVGLKYSFGKP